MSKSKFAERPPRRAPAGGARTISLRFKLMVYFLVILALPLVTLGIIGPSLYASSLERESMSYTEKMIGQVTMSIELRVLEMEKLIDLVSQLAPVAALLEEGEDRKRVV